MIKRTQFLQTAIVTSMFLSVGPANAVTDGNIDDFEDGTTMGWQEGAGQGAPNPNPPTNVANGGPSGAGDNFLENVSDGVGVGGKQLIFNTGANWTGNFVAEDINVIRLDVQVDVTSEGPLELRLAIEGTNGARYLSTNSVSVPDDGIWHRIYLQFAESDMTQVSGIGTFAQTAASVAQVRLMHRPLGVAWQGVDYNGLVGYDNIATLSASFFTGWLWETGVVHSPAGVQLIEEYCFGQIFLGIDSTDEWLVTGQDACVGRSTTNTNPARNHLNYDPGTGTILEVESFIAQSTQPLVSAGGNLFELYGEDIDLGVGEGEERLATVLAEPSGSDLLIIGGYEKINVVDEVEAFGFTDLLVKDSPDVRAARVTADLEGLWYTSFFNRFISRNNVDNNLSQTGLRVLDLQAGGVCVFSEPTVIQDPEVVNPGDSFLGVQVASGGGIDLSDRGALAFINLRDRSNCTWEIDINDYLSLDFTSTNITQIPPVDTAINFKFVVADDNNYLVSAPDPDGVEEDNISLVIGFRAPVALMDNSIDGTYLFYLNLTDYESSGSAHSFGSIGTQVIDVQGRGRITFDSMTPGTAPEGLPGVWYACDLDIVLGEAEYRANGQPGMLNVTTSLDLLSDRAPIDCDYNLAADGSLLLNLKVSDPGDPLEEILFAGYVNSNAEVMHLIDMFSEIENPGGQVGTFVDSVSIRHILAMKYTGNLTGNEDGDEFSNFEEFLLPLPPREVVDTTGFADASGDGLPDFATFFGDSGNQAEALLFSGDDGSNFGTLRFLNPAWDGVAIDTVDDSNGDGVADDPGVAMLLVEPATGKMLVQIRVAATGANVNKINFLNPDWAPVDVVVFNDPNGDGDTSDTSIGVMAVHRTTGKILIQVRALSNGAKTATRSFLNLNYTPVAAASADRAGLPSILGVLGVETATGKILVQTRQLDNGALQDNQKFLSTEWTAKDIARVKDGDSNGTADDPGWLVLANNTVTGKNIVQARFASTGMKIDDINYLTPAYLAQRLATTDDIDLNGREEAAVLAKRLSDEQRILQIRDFQNETRTGNIFP